MTSASNSYKSDSDCFAFFQIVSNLQTWVYFHTYRTSQFRKGTFSVPGEQAAGALPEQPAQL